MGISTDRTLRQQFIFFTIIFMLTGLFVSRALLSISMVLFLAFCFVHKDFSIQLRAFIRHPLLVGISLCLPGSGVRIRKHGGGLCGSSSRYSSFHLLLQGPGNFLQNNGNGLPGSFYGWFLPVAAGAYGNMRQI